MAKNTQMLKGILEGCVLKIIKDYRTYGYDIVSKLHDYGFESMTEGTIYPMLSRMESNGLLETLDMASPKGPQRRYYFLSQDGKKALKTFEKEWTALEGSVSEIMNHKK